MLRPRAVTSRVAIFCLFGASCQALTGSVDVVVPPDRPRPMAAPAVSGGTPMPRPASEDAPVGPGEGVLELPGLGVSLDDRVAPATGGSNLSSDAGSELEADAGPPPGPRPVVALGEVALLARIGEEGGAPHLGRCDGGVAIGLRATANPSDGVFGERVTLIEPICGTLLLHPAAADSASGRIVVVPDDAILSWPVTDVLQGPPVREVPDARLVWELQPPTLCPEAAPVLVGLSGDYEPRPPGSLATAIVRSVVIECAPLVVGPDGVEVSASASDHEWIAQGDNFAADGSDVYASSCTDGAVTTQILVHAGYWLDGFTLGCSSLASPRLEGESCGEDGDCGSGVCGAVGSCAP